MKKDTMNEFDVLIKLVLIGGGAVGKTVLMTRYVENTYTENSRRTIGVDFNMKCLVVDGSRVKLQIWDTDGSESARTIATAYYRSAHGIMLLYDVGSRRTFDHVPNWIAEVKKSADPDVSLMLVASKCDNAHRQVTYEEGKALAEELGMKFVEVDAKTNTNVEAAFYQIAAEVKDKLLLKQAKDPLVVKSGAKSGEKGMSLFGGFFASAAVSSGGLFRYLDLESYIVECVKKNHRSLVDDGRLRNLLGILKSALGVSDGLDKRSHTLRVEDLVAVCEEVGIDEKDRNTFPVILSQISEYVIKRALDMTLQKGGRRWRRSRLMILGQGRAGKSSFLRSLSGQEYDGALPSTKGLSVGDFIVDSAEIREAGASVNDFISWKERPADVTEREQTLRQEVSHQARAIKVTRTLALTQGREVTKGGWFRGLRRLFFGKASSKQTASLRESASSIGSTEPKGGMSSMNSRDKGSDTANNMGDFSNISSNSADLITFSVWDYGGQRVFQTMQHILLTRNGVFAVVFDMNNVSPLTASQQCIDNSLLYIKHWLRQIDMLAKGAPIFLIGTHKDSLFSEDVHDGINTVLSGVVQGYEVNHNGNLCFYPVDNTNLNDRVIESLRHLLENAAENDPAGYVNEEIPTSWLNMCDRLHQMARDDTPYIFRENPEDVSNTPDIKTIALDCGVIAASMDSVQQDIIITSMLSKMHEKGTYLYFPFEKHMHNIVVLNPQWIIDNIVFVMRDFTLHPFNRDNDIVRKYPNEWLKLTRHGILSDSILSIFWREEIHNKNFLMSMLEKLKIAGRLPYSDSQGNSIYLLPSVVLSSDNIPPDIPIPLNWRDNWMNEVSGLVRLRFVEESIPEGFFSRLIVQIISMITSTNILPASLPSFVGQLTSLNAPCVFFCNGAYCAAIVLEDSHVIVLRPSTGDLSMIEVFVPSASSTILPACCHMIRSAIDELNKIFYYNCLKYELRVKEVINRSSVPSPSLHPPSSCLSEEAVYAHPFNEEDKEGADEERLLKDFVTWLMSSGGVKTRKHAEKYAGLLIEDGFYTVETLHENFVNGKVTREKLRDLGISVDLNISNILEALRGMPAPLALADAFLASFFNDRSTEVSTIEQALAPTKKMDHWRMHEKSVGFLASTLQSGHPYTFLHLSADPTILCTSPANKNTLPFMRTDVDDTFPEPELLVDVVASCMRHGIWSTQIEGVFINASNSWTDFGLQIHTQNKNVVVIGWKTRIDVAGSELFVKEFYRNLRDKPGKYGDAYKAAKWQLRVHHNYFCEDPDDVTKLNSLRANNNPRACFVGIPHIITPTEFDIFFSHPWANKNVLRHVKGFLEKKGYRVWYDEDEIGWNMKKCMEEGIMRSKVFLVCLNSTYEGRENCMFELKEAKSINKTIVTLITQPNPFDKLPTTSGWAGKNTTFGNAMELCSLKTMKFYDIGELFQRPEWAENPVTPVDPVILATLLVELEAKVDDLCLLLRDKGVNCEPFY